MSRSTVSVHSNVIDASGVGGGTYTGQPVPVTVEDAVKE